MPGNYEAANQQAIAAAQAEVTQATDALRQAMQAGQKYGDPQYMTAYVRLAQAKQKLAAAQNGQAIAKQQDEAAVSQQQRTSVIDSLQRIADGGGSAYGATMRQVDQGNRRIRALAAGGRGGLNANLNAANAIGISTAAGTQQAVANREAEKSQARAALGQAIAQGQDYNTAEGQSVLNALSQTPEAKNPAENLRPAAQLGEAIWGATQGTPSDEQRRNQQSAGLRRW